MVGDETGFIQVLTAAVGRGMIVLVSSRFRVPQNVPVTEINIKRVDLRLEHSLQSRLSNCRI